MLLSSSNYLYLITLLASIAVYNCSSQCIFRDGCDSFVSEYGQSKIPCTYSGPPAVINDTDLLESLQEFCPFLNPIGNPLLCCARDQIENLVSQLAVPKGMLGRCPSCFYNFANMFCQMSCSPIQSSFLRLDSWEPSKTVPNRNQTTQITYAIDEKYAQTLFNSCVNVLAPGPGDKPIKIMCGQWGDQCTPHRLLGFVGQKNPSPFQINFQYFPESNVIDIKPLSMKSSQCFEAPGVFNKSACSCSDCPSVCKPLPQPTPHENFKIFGIDGMSIVMALLFVLTTSIVVINFRGYSLSKSNASILDAKYDGPQSVARSPTLPINQTNNQQVLVSATTRTPAESNESIGSRLEKFLEDSFTNWGYILTYQPILPIIIGLAFIAAASSQLIYIGDRITSDPVELWSSPKSQARLEKQYFDEHFGPFYRTNQLIIKKTTDEPNFDYTTKSGKNYSFNSIFEEDFLMQILQIQDEITSLTVNYNDEIIKLNDICFSPLGNGKCAVQSVLGWFQNNETRFIGSSNDSYTYLDHIVSCLSNPYALADNLKPYNFPCLGEYGGPALPKVALGGFDLKESIKSAADAYTKASTLIITILINNHVNKSENKPAEKWEKAFLDYMNSFNHTKYPNMDISYYSERSVQDEIDRQSLYDISTIVVSYLVMFAYVSLTLGRISNLSNFFVHSKIVLGLVGVLIVIASVASSIGIMIFCGFNLTLIIMEVIPFLVLAVGVDNIFILVQHLERHVPGEGETSRDSVAKVLGKCGPSILMAFACEVACFFIGSTSSMPAIRIFALNAALALIIDFVLQMSVFIAILYLDLVRSKESRFDIFCCCKSNKINNVEEIDEIGLLHKVCQDHYAPFLMKDKVRCTLLIGFLFWLCSSVAVLNKVDVGLDQELSMPHDSYVLKYFKSQKRDLNVGPPVYFVLGGNFNYSDVLHQSLICGTSFCGENSLFNQISQASREPESSYIVDTPASWLDDYFDWAGSSQCCRVEKKDTHQFCPSTLDPDYRKKECKLCPLAGDDTAINPSAFYKYLSLYLSDVPNSICPKAGRGAYGTAVKLDENNKVLASHFSSYHSPLVKSSDFIAAMKNARFLASNIKRAIETQLDSGEEITLFPYSLIYVFYEQYLTIYHDSFKNLFLSIGSIFLVSFVLYGFNIRSSLIVVFTIICIIINLMGMMYWWDISLNALSLVNLVMACGISVEFCSHIAHAYLLSAKETRKERSQEAIATMGSSVLSGITLTKFAGILVLAWSTSQIFVVFYFRMYFGIVIIGALHGLILLPVLLSIFGDKPVPKASKESSSPTPTDQYETIQ